jgi:hypothetical protein
MGNDFTYSVRLLHTGTTMQRQTAGQIIRDSRGVHDGV